MYRKCPKCGYESPDNEASLLCEQCGLVYDKWLKNQFKSEVTSKTKSNKRGVSTDSLVLSAKNILFFVPDNVSPERFYLNLVIYVVFFVWGWSFIVADHYSAILNESFMHLINLVFHEAGHVIFALFGDFMRIIGGSLLQLIVPLVILFSLLLKNKDAFGASIALWWFAQSLMDLVSYINDAKSQEMWLLGGVQGKDMPGIHDWNNILAQLNLLDSAYSIAGFVSWFAIFVMLLAFIWGGLILKKMY